MRTGALWQSASGLGEVRPCGKDPATYDNHAGGEVERVGLIGLGHMGSAMVERLLHRGFAVYGYDNNPESRPPTESQGFTRCDSARAVASECSVVIVSVLTGEQLENVVLGANGLASAGRSDLLVIDTSTVDPADSERIATELEHHGSQLLRSPVSGGTPEARAGQLLMLISGAEASFERARSVFEALGGKGFSYLGPGERSRYAKLGINVIVIGAMALLAEGLRLAEAGGMTRDEMADFIGASVGASPHILTKLEKIRRSDYTATGSVSQARKDLTIVRALARRHKVPTPLADSIEALLISAEEQGFASHDLSFVVDLESDQGHGNPSTTNE